MIADVQATFLHFLADNLTDIPVHPIRSDPDDPSTSNVKVGAINVEFLNVNPAMLGNLQVSIDIIDNSELQCLTWLDSLYELLSAAFFTPLYSFEDPSSPARLSTNVFWNRESVRFTKVYSEHYCHYACVMPLRFSAYAQF